MDGCAEGDFVETYDARHREWVVGRVLRVRGAEAHVAWHARAGFVEDWYLPFAGLRAVALKAGPPPGPPEPPPPQPPPQVSQPGPPTPPAGPESHPDPGDEHKTAHEHAHEAGHEDYRPRSHHGKKK